MSEPPLQLHSLTAMVGSEVSGVELHRRPLSSDTIGAISDALADRGVLVFPGQHRVDTKDQLALIQALNTHWGLEAKTEQQRGNYVDGAFVIRMLNHKVGSPNVWQVACEQAQRSGQVDSAQAPNPSTGGFPQSRVAIWSHWMNQSGLLQRRAPGQVASGKYFHAFGGSTGNWTRYGHETTRAGNVWHSDDNYVLQPPWCTVLRALSLPSVGGDTVFADMSLAYNDLDDATQSMLNGLVGIADWRQVFPHYLEESVETIELRHIYPRVAHPIVRTHPTSGRRALYCNAIYTIGLQGLEESHAAGLLQDLLTMPTIPEYQCRVRWRQPGDVVIWDNRHMQHYAVSDYVSDNSALRSLEHTASLGDTPFFLGSDGTRVESRFVDGEDMNVAADVVARL